MALGLPARITLGDKTIAGFLNKVLAEINKAVRELSGLDDVTFTGVSTDEVMEFNGTVWVNTGRAATTLKTGFVKQAAVSTDANASSVSVTAADITDTAGGTYTATEQGMLNDLKALANEIKSDVNTLVTDVNAIKDGQNDLKAKLRTAGTLAT